METQWSHKACRHEYGQPPVSGRILQCEFLKTGCTQEPCRETRHIEASWGSLLGTAYGSCETNPLFFLLRLCTSQQEVTRALSACLVLGPMLISILHPYIYPVFFMKQLPFSFRLSQYNPNMSLYMPYYNVVSCKSFQFLFHYPNFPLECTEEFG